MWIEHRIHIGEGYELSSIVNAFSELNMYFKFHQNSIFPPKLVSKLQQNMKCQSVGCDLR